jgi:hypothetical protein
VAPPPLPALSTTILHRHQVASGRWLPTLSQWTTAQTMTCHPYLHGEKRPAKTTNAAAEVRVARTELHQPLVEERGWRAETSVRATEIVRRGAQSQTTQHFEAAATAEKVPLQPTLVLLA